MSSSQPNASNISGYLRLNEVLKIIPVSTSVWYENIQKGIYPKPVKIASRCSAWKKCDIEDLVERINKGELEGSQ